MTDLVFSSAGEPDDWTDWYDSEVAEWRRSVDYEDGWAEYERSRIDWAAFERRMRARTVARLKYRRSLLEGVCLEGAWGVGEYRSIEPDRRYL
jgi:hypothetical protein